MSTPMTLFRSSLLLVAWTLLSTAACCQESALPHFVLSEGLEVRQIAPHAYLHVSASEIPPFGLVFSNGLLYVVDGEALLFDTPTSDSATAELVRWVTGTLHARIVGFVPNHWHNDCMGGLAYLHRSGIPSSANELTRRIASSRGLPVPLQGFTDSLALRCGNETVSCQYFGAGHTPDNIVVWLPREKILFAGCMAKEIAARSLGNTADADLAAWPGTLRRVLAAFPGARIVVPGHGRPGGIDVLQHTLELLSARN
jgi:metallo-beta-lactamase class B